MEWVARTLWYTGEACAAPPRILCRPAYGYPMALHHYRRLLRLYLRPQGRRVAVLGGLLLAALAADLGNPLLLRAFIDAAAGNAPLTNLLTLAGVFLGLALAGQIVSVAE